MEKKEIKYIPYGTDEIDYDLFITNAANEVLNYVNSQSWSNKRKESFLNAYLNLISQGITGASNDSGIWKINHNGDIPLETLSKRDREMYGEAAYFLRLQMSRITPRKKEEEKKKEDLEEFNFSSQFLPLIWNNRYGGNKDLFASEWENLDERGKNGLRGINNRKIALKEELTKYKENLINNKGKYNFKGTAFKDEDDVIRRIDEAIAAIDSPDLKDDNPKLNALGLSYNLWFSNGGNDIYGTTDDGKLVTYQLYYENQLKEALEKAKTEVEAKKQATYNNTLFFNRVTNSKMLGQNPQSLKLKYRTDLQLRQALYQYSQGNIQSLTPNLLSEILGAYRYLAKDPIDNKLLKQLLSSSSGRYAGAVPSRFKKINGIDNLIWDNLAGQVIQINNRQQQQAILNQPLDLFKGVKTLEELNKEKDKAQLQYLNNTEWTADLTRELMGIAADVASVVDPEPLTAGGLALTGTGLRAYNRATDADGFTLSDAGHTTLDTGLSLLGMIPVVGDAALAARVVSKLLKAAGWLGAAFAAASVPQAAKAAWNKVVNGQDMTVDDWRAIGNVLMGVTQARRIQLNRAAGNAVRNQDRTITKEKVGEVEVKINGKTEKVEIDEASAKELQQAYKAAGNDLKATTEALRKSRKVREQLEAKKTSDGKPTYTKEQLDAMEAPQAASGSVRGRIPRAHDTRGIKITERSIQTSGTPVSKLNLGPLAQMRINAILNNTGWFNRGDFGWNMRVRNSEQQSSGWLSRMWLNLKNPYKPKTQKQQETPKTNSTEVPKTTETKSTETPKINKQKMNELKEKFGRSKTESSNPKLEYNLKQQHKSEREIELFEKSYGTKNSSSKNTFGEGYGSNNTIKNGELNVDLGNGIKFNFKVNNASEYKVNPGKVSTLRGLVAKKIQEQLHNKDVDRIKVGNLLKELKRKGWLKQGGTINNLDTEIKEILKTL